MGPRITEGMRPEALKAFTAWLKAQGKDLDTLEDNEADKLFSKWLDAECHC